MNKNSKASEILAKRREENIINLQNRVNEVYGKIPNMKALDKTIKDLGFKIVSYGLDNINTEDLENEQRKLLDLKEKLLVENGFSKDYLQMHYHHELCKDTGFVGTEICSCRKQIIIEENYSNSSIKSLILRENFDSFDANLFSANPYKDYPISPRENILLIKDELLKFVNNFDKEKSNLYIFGDVGRGKTFLLNALAKEILDRNYSVFYITSSSLFKFLNDYNRAFEEQRSKHQEKYDFIKECDLLIIDDLGSEATSKNDPANLFDIVNSRMISEKPIIFSTNYDESMLSEVYGGRIFSRIVGNSKVYEVFGEDLRLKER